MPPSTIDLVGITIYIYIYITKQERYKVAFRQLLVKKWTPSFGKQFGLGKKRYYFCRTTLYRSTHLAPLHRYSGLKREGAFLWKQDLCREKKKSKLSPEILPKITRKYTSKFCWFCSQVNARKIGKRGKNETSFFPHVSVPSLFCKNSPPRVCDVTPPYSDTNFPKHIFRIQNHGTERLRCKNCP